VRWLFNLVIYYPVWSVPLAFGAFQVAVHMNRRKSKARYFWGAFGVALLVTAAIWVVFRGDLHGAAWIEGTFGVQRVRWD
jgi:hypothetical protein